MIKESLATLLMTPDVDSFNVSVPVMNFVIGVKDGKRTIRTCERCVGMMKNGGSSYQKVIPPGSADDATDKWVHNDSCDL